MQWPGALTAYDELWMGSDGVTTMMKTKSAANGSGASVAEGAAAVIEMEDDVPVHYQEKRGRTVRAPTLNPEWWR